MNEEQFERLVQSFESIAASLGEICVIQRRYDEHDHPQRSKPREAVITRIKNEEDLIRERQGAGDGPISEWLGGYEESAFIGAREKAFLEEEKQRNASAEAIRGEGPDRTSDEAARSKARAARERSAIEPNDKN